MKKKSSQQLHMLRYTLTEQLIHGMEVSNLAYDLARELGYEKEICYELAKAGVLHDIGKVVLENYVEEQDTLVVEEMRFVRTHPTLGYELLQGRGYSDFVLESILYHHENYDGTGYPANLAGEKIPFGARILRICDVYCALTSDRPYRSAFTQEQAMELMAEEVKNFDLKMFLAFQRVIHSGSRKAIELSDVDELIQEIIKEKQKMALKKKPVTGMKDILPKEMAIRDYVIRLIKETYGTFGFTSMETPCVEHIENLNSKQGGENEKLIFKILKRGEKLKLETAEKENDLVDSGLRYDLTVPLCRYYSNNANELPSPFKALQMGNVWRADRPQRGRYRQFMQCDIDILGEPTNLAEIELILATTTLLGKLDFKNFTIRINDRRILKAMAAYSGFPEESYDTVFIILDKMDKIGFEGVAKELEEAGFAKESVEKYLKMFEEITPDTAGVEYCREKLEGFLDKEYADGLKTIIDSVNAVKTAEFKIAFDPTLVRGMSYYTGPIFEIAMDEYGGSVGGGGRYDEMIGKFTGNQTCACGFSIGFERIVMLLLERDYQIPGAQKKKAYLIEKNMPAEGMQKIIQQATKERSEGTAINIAVMKKNKKFQKEQLASEGYTEIEEFFVDKM